jgi:hypothetical protein
MKELYKVQPSRLFTFGCSFTDYYWATWANILAYELDCEFYNFGRSGAGNSYIANAVSQADLYYKFNQNDLIMICWTNISREDRWMHNHGWVTPGNIYSQDEYDSAFVKNYANEIHFALRDFSHIYLIDNLLINKTQYHFFSMCNITDKFNQWKSNNINELNLSQLKKLYNPILIKFLPSFYEILWENNFDKKIEKDKVLIDATFRDGHPTILEHYEFIIKTFSYKFSKKSLRVIKETQYNWQNFVKNNVRKGKNGILYTFSSNTLREMKQLCSIRHSKDRSSSLIL